MFKWLFGIDEQDELVEKLTRELTREPVYEEQDLLDPLYRISCLISTNESDYVLGKINKEEYLATIKELELILNKIEQDEMRE